MALLKRILRGWRNYLKEKFVSIHSTKYFYWNPEMKRKKVSTFFRLTLGIDEKLYEDNEAIFFKLILSTSKLEEFGITPQKQYTDLMAKVFGD